MIEKADFFAALSRVTGQAADRLGKIKPEQAWEAINLIQEEEVSRMFNDLEKKMDLADDDSTISLGSIPLIELLIDAKFGRKAKEQELIDEFISLTTEHFTPETEPTFDPAKEAVTISVASQMFAPTPEPEVEETPEEPTQEGETDQG